MCLGIAQCGIRGVLPLACVKSHPAFMFVRPKRVITIPSFAVKETKDELLLARSLVSVSAPR